AGDQGSFHDGQPWRSVYVSRNTGKARMIPFSPAVATLFRSLSMFVRALLLGLLLASSLHAEWKAGAARVKITPEKPMWMSGYSSRDKPAEGTLHDLWTKALAIEDEKGQRAILITMDLVGIPRDLSVEVCDAIRKK